MTSFELDADPAALFEPRFVRPNPVGPDSGVIHLHSVEFDRLEETFFIRQAETDSFQKRLRKLSARALLMSRRGDIVILDSQPEKDYLDYLLALGLGSEQIISVGTGEESTAAALAASPRILDRLKSAGKTGRLTLMPYSSTDRVHGIASRIGADFLGCAPQLYAQLSGKDFFKTLSTQAGVPVIPYKTVRQVKLRQEGKTFLAKRGRMIIRGDLSLGGSKVWRADSEKELLDISSEIDLMADGGIFLLEEYIYAKSSPNIQLLLEDNSIRFVWCSDQIMAGFKHKGNIAAPGNYGGKIAGEIIGQSMRIAEFVYGMKYRGIMGIDFIVTQAGTVWPAEINPRMNTSTYAAYAAGSVAEKAGRPPRIVKYAQYPCNTDIVFDTFLAKVGEKNLLSATTATGILPFNLASADSGMIDAVIMAETVTQIARLEEILSMAKFTDIV